MANPIVFFDLETTGSNPTNDRIVEIAYVKVFTGTDMEPIQNHTLVNPTIPIPAGATEVHGITDEMVSDKPPFCQIAKSIVSLFDGCDVCGFSIRTFDIPLLMQELFRCGLSLNIQNIFDSHRIYKYNERRDLTSAVKFYLNETLEGAHGALADTVAAMRVFNKQLDIYPELRMMSPYDLHVYCNGGVKALDVAGKIYLNEYNVPCYAFGTKTKDVPVHQDTGFAEWVLKNDFPEDTKQVLRKILSELK